MQGPRQRPRQPNYALWAFAYLNHRSSVSRRIHSVNCWMEESHPACLAGLGRMHGIAKLIQVFCDPVQDALAMPSPDVAARHRANGLSNAVRYERIV